MNNSTQTDVFDTPVEISDSIWWVGKRSNSLLERNIYLRRFKAGGSLVNLLISPGPPEDLGYLLEKLKTLIGGVKNINLMFINHQDADEAANSAYIQKMNPNLYILCSEDTWRLIKFYGLSEKNHRFVEQFKNMTVTLSTGHQLSFIPSPFCHFKGAVMLYDHETRILFSGDLFGGLSYSPDLYATKDHWEGMKAFHQIYMPTQEALKYAIDSIRKVDQVPLMIAPQHGPIIGENLVETYMDKLEHLPVGLDLFIHRKNVDMYISAMNELVEEFSKLMGAKRVLEILSLYQTDGSFPDVLAIQANRIVSIKTDPQDAMDNLTTELYGKTPEALKESAELSIIRTLLTFNLPAPENLSTDEVAPPPEFFEID